jgi:DNA-binding transcriptional LysR family regulator
MKRLKDDLGVAIFRKRGRGLVLTEAGETVLSYARRILILNDELVDTTHSAALAGHVRIGCPQDFASMLPSVLSDFALLYPRMQIELHIEGNAALVDAMENARLDLAVVIGHEGHANAQTVGQLNLVWIASSAFSPPHNEPLPLAVLGPQCAFRRRALQALEAASIPCRNAANSPSLDGLWAALLGGLGVTARTALNVPDGLVSGDSLHGLPPLGSMPVTLHRDPRFNDVAADRMASLLMKALKLALQPMAKRRVLAHFRNDAVNGKHERH